MYNYLPLLDTLSIISFFTMVVVGIGLVIKPGFREKFLELFALPTPSSGGVFPALDILRGVAALWVVAYHAWQWLVRDNPESVTPIIRQGYKGVALFCLLSGFLIYRSLERSGIGRSTIRNYFIRRLLRIYPLFLTTTLVAFLLILLRVYLPFPELWESNRSPVTLLTPLADLLFFRIFFDDCCLNPPAWSLTVEVLFYLTLPLYLLITQSRKLVVTLALILILIFLEGLQPFREVQLIKYFLIGIVAAEVYQLLQSLTPKRRLLISRLLFVSGLFLLYIDLVAERDWLATLLHPLFSLTDSAPPLSSTANFLNSAGFGFGGAALLIALCSFNPRGNRIVDTLFYILRFPGIISYSIYLWHALLLSFDFNLVFYGSSWYDLNQSGKLPYTMNSELFIFTLLPALLLVSALSYLFLERPFLKLRPGKLS